VNQPGGCAIGARPIDYHLEAFRELGIDVVETHDSIRCTCSKITPRKVSLAFPSVGATENIMLASAKSTGSTIIYNGAKEPEIMDLQKYLCKIGVNVSGVSTNEIVISGVTDFKDAEFSVMPDRIVLATYILATIATNGNLEIVNFDIDHHRCLLGLLNKCGCYFRVSPNSISVKMDTKLRAIDFIQTLPYPGFPTDLQSPFTLLLTQANGMSKVHEVLFESRLNWLVELEKLGANIDILNPHQAMIF